MASRSQKAARTAEADMARMRAKHGVEYVGYHESIAKGEETTKAQRDAYNTRMQELSKPNAARRNRKKGD